MNEIHRDQDEFKPAEGEFLSPARESNNISRIRDIIFGNEMREFSRRFRTLERSLENHKREIDERYSALEARLSNQFDLMRGEIRQGLQEIERKSAERNDELSQQYQTDFRRLSDTIDSNQREVSDHVSRFVAEQGSRLAELREQIHRSHEQMRHDLMEECDTLDGNKVSRYDLGDSLIALGMRLKDDTILEELSVQLLEDDEG